MKNPLIFFSMRTIRSIGAHGEDKPVFLSIGYSTCHWCHVMERESFEDAQAADVLNSGFISIKVDREERPDIDAVYMAVCQAMTGSGGWPLTILMTPEQKPFWAGTYLPKYSRYGQPGLIDLLKRVSLLWRTEREQLLQAGDAEIPLAAQPALSHELRPVGEIRRRAFHGGKDADADGARRPVRPGGRRFLTLLHRPAVACAAF